ncbi:MAG: ATP-binding protein [Pseudonocardia sp.]
MLAGRPDFADLLSSVWEIRSAGSSILLTLSGSAVSVMEEMLGPRGGLHRRATWEHRLDPFDLAAAREFLPSARPDAYIEAYAACGGYPLHLLRWDPDRTREENLRELAFTPGGLLLRDAQDILSEDLDWRGGYERVLGALGAGTRRRSRIASRAQQRIDYTLDRLRRAGYVRAVRPHGAPPTADPLYEITDPYLAFWFAVLRDDADLVEGGQGAAVAARTAGRWQAHIGRVFAHAARDHAVRLAAAGALPAATTIGRWWRDETVEIDVLGLLAGQARLVGEAKWQAAPLDLRALHGLRARSRHLPDLHPDVTFGLWARGGATTEVVARSDVAVYTPADMV